MFFLGWAINLALWIALLAVVGGIVLALAALYDLIFDYTVGGPLHG